MKKLLAYFEELFSSLFSHTRKEEKGVILICLLAGSLLSFVYFSPQSMPESDYLAETDRLNDSLRSHMVPTNRSLSYRPDAGKNDKKKQTVFFVQIQTENIRLYGIESGGFVTTSIGERHRKSTLRTDHILSKEIRRIYQHRSAQRGLWNNGTKF